MDISINGAKILYTFTDVPLFGTVHITQTLVVSWLVMAIITVACVVLGSGLKVTNISRKQAVAETIYGALINFVHGNMGTGFDRYIPLVGAIFATSVVSNLISLLGIWSPTADLMTELGWALVVFVLITYHKIKSSGIGGYLKSYLDPIFVMAPINVISELFTPISMACRHFGNILSGTVISALIYAALATASYALFDLLGSNIVVAAAILIVGIVLVVRARKLKAAGGKAKGKIPGIVLTVLGALALLAAMTGGLAAKFPWLDIGIPAITSFYFDWFSGCIQAFIFCTLTTIFIKQAAGED
ncbi:F0F1 ATP synthase subunit A [bacterium]|uniref:F0F1 ATP synthase subunit A n=1 Tax=Gemmiger sp. TaxID=2049027 RepID=UPI002A813568|nr:FoF1 ATP synthase subunit a [Gemmiger sp.]MCI5557237.1 F0F1 ATP synthase subunit A [bacterium]MCI6083085.1 F0F1 ATP synthase subunit A [bacterium]MCI6248241.1 F0F1 ATP synthase subunit A [bacterium]MDD5858121.1 F0F1 ATP synthase subunit A [bacterium]MDY4879534.1 FoF1 ATP synthase subunit a [Gemmiger sp.]